MKTIEAVIFGAFIGIAGPLAVHQAPKWFKHIRVEVPSTVAPVQDNFPPQDVAGNFVRQCGSPTGGISLLRNPSTGRYYVFSSNASIRNYIDPDVSLDEACPKYGVSAPLIYDKPGAEFVPVPNATGPALSVCDKDGNCPLEVLPPCSTEDGVHEGCLPPK